MLSTADKSYNKDTPLYDLLAIDQNEKNTLQDNENKLASDKYYVKQSDDERPDLREFRIMKGGGMIRDEMLKC